MQGQKTTRKTKDHGFPPIVWCMEGKEDVTYTTEEFKEVVKKLPKRKIVITITDDIA